MDLPSCQGCSERDARIADLTARLAEAERFQRETAYLRDEIKSDHDLRLLTGESRTMKAVRHAIQQVAQVAAALRSGRIRNRGLDVAVGTKKLTYMVRNPFTCKQSRRESLLWPG
jgi:hypothetical protein